MFQGMTCQQFRTQSHFQSVLYILKGYWVYGWPQRWKETFWIEQIAHKLKHLEKQDKNKKVQTALHMDKQNEDLILKEMETTENLNIG